LQKYGAILFVDDAHGTGTIGKHGGGVGDYFGLEGQIDLVMGTFSKTFAVTGGFVAAAKPLVDYLRFLHDHICSLLLFLLLQLLQFWRA